MAAATGGFDVTFTGDLGDQAVPLLTADAGELVNVSLLSYHQDTGELDFDFDIGTSVSIVKPEPSKIHGMWVLDQTKMAPVSDVLGWKIDGQTMAEIDRILQETITDPVGPEFMAPPDRVAALA